MCRDRVRVVAGSHPHSALCCWASRGGRACGQGIKAGPQPPTASLTVGSRISGTAPQRNLMHLEWGLSGHWHGCKGSVFPLGGGTQTPSQDCRASSSSELSSIAMHLCKLLRGKAFGLVCLCEDWQVREESHLQGRLGLCFCHQTASVCVHTRPLITLCQERNRVSAERRKLCYQGLQMNTKVIAWVFSSFTSPQIQ